MRADLFILLVALAQIGAVAMAQDKRAIVISPAGVGPTTCITHVTVIDMETGDEAQDRTVIISGDRIAEVKNSHEVKMPAGARIVDGTGKYLIPGLWDMHVHGTKYDASLHLYIANGVTGVREMFGPPDANKFRAELGARIIDAPHIYLGSPIVDGKPPDWPDSIIVETPEKARQVVDEQKQRGADFIKVYNELSREVYFAIIEEAKEQNIPVEGHVPVRISVWEATAAKQKSIEHLMGMALACSSRNQDLWPKAIAARDEKEADTVVLQAWRSHSDDKCQQLFTEFKKNGSWPVPTLAADRSFGFLNDAQFTSDNRIRYFGGEFRDWLMAKDDPRMKQWTASEFEMERELFADDKRLVGELFRAGVPMLAGTDSGNPFCFPGFSLHDELALLVDSGVTPLGALQAATRNPAIFMKAEDRYGSVTAGRVADLVLLNADPLKDIRNTTRISEVFLGGKEFDRSALDQALRNAEAEAKETSAH